MPQAANMRKLKWNKILARQAQEIADKCEPFIPPVSGQNVHAASHREPYENLNETAAGVPYSWVDDLSYFKWNSLKINENPAELRRFLQMILDETSLVGCGLKDCGKINGFYKYVVVCKYDPPMSEADSVVYVEGPACSNCSVGLTCDDSTKLCYLY